ncbi:MAG: AraC family transcriptional regulator [Coriobacteriales bacterium]|jgi:AraC-like DNA-binding protein|nr:AraC family transcriptional regulator [Coriobacteriales bacterium]
MEMPYLPLRYERSDVFPTTSMSIRPGMHITVSSGTLQKKLEWKTEAVSPLFELSYNRNKAICGEVGRTIVEHRPGYSSLGFLGPVCGHSEYDCGDEVKLYSIWVGPKVFDGFCQSVNGKDSVGFRSFHKGAYNCCSFKTDAREEGILGKLDRCFSGEADNLNRLLLESQVLELLSLNLERLLGAGSDGIRPEELSRTDIECLARAREILLARLESPPSLLELSRLIQMNDCKLKRSFKRYFGKTVYEFIREQRLEKAFFLLQDGRYNVSQSASAVGYTNLSHFSQVFRSRFGVNPSELLSCVTHERIGKKNTFCQLHP